MSWGIALYTAIQDGHLENIEKNVKPCKENINSVLFRGTQCTYHTPLTAAVNKGDKVVVNFLLKLGADINYKALQSRTPLEEAIVRNDVAMVKHLIEKGADINYKNTSIKETPLLCAIKKSGDEEIVEELIKNKANINQVIENRQCALIAASDISNAMVNLLIKNGADVNLIDYNKRTPLTYAVQNRKFQFCEMLLKCGADANLEDGEQKTPLWWAIQEQVHKERNNTFYDTRLIALLLENGADKKDGLICALKLGYAINAFLGDEVDIDQYDKNGKSPLLLAVENNQLESFKLLINKGANVNLIHPCGNTILALLCAKTYSVKYVEYLLQYGANVCKVGKGGKAPLIWAVERHNLEIVKLLLQHRAHLSLPSAFLTSIRRNSFQMVKYLKEQGASVNAVHRDNTTPLLTSLDGGNLEIIQYLIDNQADTSVLLKHDNTLLIKWIKSKNLQMVEKIIEIGVNLNAAGNCGSTPLLASVVEGNLKIVQCLVEKSVEIVANINITGNCGSTPLTKALELELYSVAKCLVENKADVNLADANGRIPLSLAAANFDFPNVELLIDHGADLDASWDELEAFAKYSDDFDIFFKPLIPKRKCHKVGRKTILDLKRKIKTNN